MVAVVFVTGTCMNIRAQKLLMKNFLYSCQTAFPSLFAQFCLSFRLRKLPSYPSYYIGVLWGASNWDQDGSGRRFATVLETCLAIRIGKTTDSTKKQAQRFVSELRKTK